MNPFTIHANIVKKDGLFFSNYQQKKEIFFSFYYDKKQIFFLLLCKVKLTFVRLEKIKFINLRLFKS